MTLIARLVLAGVASGFLTGLTLPSAWSVFVGGASSFVLGSVITKRDLDRRTAARRLGRLG